MRNSEILKAAMVKHAGSGFWGTVGDEMSQLGKDVGIGAGFGLLGGPAGALIGAGVGATDYLTRKMFGTSMTDALGNTVGSAARGAWQWGKQKVTGENQMYTDFKNSTPGFQAQAPKQTLPKTPGVDPKAYAAEFAKSERRLAKQPAAPPATPAPTAPSTTPPPAATTALKS